MTKPQLLSVGLIITHVPGWGGAAGGYHLAQRVAVQRISLQSASLNQTPVLLISSWVTVDK